MPRKDQELVAQCLDGSQDSFRDLVVRYQRPVHSLIVRMVRDPATAEDLAQEVFVKAFRALSSYDPSRKFSSWLFKIAHNRTIDFLRKKQLNTVALESSDEERLDLLDKVADPRGESPDEIHRRHDLAGAMEAAILELRPEYREVILLRFQEGLAYDEISEVTDLPLGTVKTHIHRARKAMAKRLEAQGWRPGG